MKQIVMILAVVVMTVGLAYAANTEGTEWQTPSKCFNKWINGNGYLDHVHNVPELKNEYGLGIDAKLWKREIKGREVDAGVEYRYDFGNDIHKTYGVIGIDLTR